MNERIERNVPGWAPFLPLVTAVVALGAVRGWFGDAGEQTIALLVAASLLAVSPHGPDRRGFVLWLVWVLAGVLAALTGTAIAPGTTLLLGLGVDLLLLAGLVAGGAALSLTAEQAERWVGAALIVAAIVASSVWWAPATPLAEGYPVAFGHARQFAGGARAVECAALILVLVSAWFRHDIAPGWFRSAGGAVTLLALGAAIDLRAGAAGGLALLALACIVTGKPLVSVAVAVLAGVAAVMFHGALAWQVRAWTAGASVLAAIQHPLGAGRGEFSAAVEPFVGRRLDFLVYESGRIFRAPENWFVGVLVERGWLGLAVLMALLGGALLVVRHRERLSYLPAVVGIILLGVASDPTWTPATAMVTGLVLARVFDLRGEDDTYGRVDVWRWLRGGLVLLALVCAAATWQVAVSQRLLASAALEQAVNRPDQEEVTLVRYADRQKRNEYAWPRLVDKRLHEERLPEAWDAAMRWLSLRPESPRAAATATVVGVAVGAFEPAAKAVPVWHHSRGVHPLWLYRNGVLALAYAQQITDALALVEEALSYWPDDLELQRLRGRLLMNQGRWNEAFDVWTRITENEQVNLKDLQLLEYTAEQAGLAPATAPTAVSEPEPDTE